jgi:hypothetical protein
MFKTLSDLTNNAFWRVSADTETCGSPQNCRLLAVCVSLMANMQMILQYTEHESTKK